MKPKTTLLLTALVAWTAVAPTAVAGDKKPTLVAVDLTIQGAALPKPALKYRLLPPFLDRHPGNAVPLYLKAIARESTSDTVWKEFYDKVYPSVEKPPAKLPVEQFQSTLRHFAGTLHSLEMATRRDRCDWEPPLREENPLAIRLPEVNQFREMARVLTAEIRLRVAQGKYDSALHDLQTGYAMARHLGDDSLLISSLVGCAIVGSMNSELEKLIQSPGSPNLFWALADLPDPLVDFRKSYESEEALAYLLFPEMQRPERLRYTPEQWSNLLDSYLKKLGELSESDTPISNLVRQAAIAAAVPISRERLVARGRAPAEVEKMPPAQALLTDVFESYDDYRHELFKWSALPYWQAREGIARSDARLKAASSAPLGGISASLARLLLPAISSVMRRHAEMQQQMAALRIVEAVRAHVAEKGRLPASLGEIKDLPIPLNPATGKPFPYRLEKDRAVLTADGFVDRQREYRLRLASPGQ